MATRISEQKILEKQSEIGRLNKYIEENEAIAKEKDGALWKIIGPRIKHALEASQKDVLSMVSSAEDRRASIAYGQHRAYSDTFDMVEKAGSGIERAREKISLLRQAIKRAQETGGVID